MQQTFSAFLAAGVVARVAALTADGHEVLAAQQGAGPAVAAVPTFSHDIAPILYEPQQDPLHGQATLTAT